VELSAIEVSVKDVQEGVQNAIVLQAALNA